MPIFSEFNDELLKNVSGVSYIGKPKNNTMMYMTKKIENRIAGLFGAENCLVFIEDTVNVPPDIEPRHNFIKCKDPAGAYTEVAGKLYAKIENDLHKKHYTLADGGYYIGENTELGDNAFIEPGAFIDHNVKIGRNVVIKSGARIKANTIIGDNCSIGENTVIGEPGFNTAHLSDGRFVVMPAFGKTIIGNNVYFGANTSVSRGSADDTVIEDNVKIDSNVRIGHDVHLHEYVEVCAEACVAGYGILGRNTVVGAAADIKNRITIGADCFIGMSSYVNHDLKDNVTVTGNPAISLKKVGEKRLLEAEMKKIVRSQVTQIAKG